MSDYTLALPALETLHAPLALLGIDIEQIIETAGPWALAIVSLIVFVESGVLFPFLPGDSLLFTLGILHGRPGFNLWIMIPVLCIVAVAGGQVGYWLGHRFGRKLFKPEAKVLNHKNLEAAEAFFDKYGDPALILARFVPVVRTFVPLVAGIAGYRYRDFAKWNISGAIIWVLLLVFAGVALGSVPFIHNNIDVIVIVIVLVSLLPVVIEVLLERRKLKKEAQAQDDAA